jgi:hypothetical protein
MLVQFMDISSGSINFLHHSQGHLNIKKMKTFGSCLAFLIKCDDLTSDYQKSWLLIILVLET